MSQLTPESGASHNLVLLAGQLLDGNGGAKTDVAVRIEGERIAAIGARSDDTLTTDATVIDLSGSTLMPGMIDAHMHFFGVPSDASNTMRFETLPYRAFRAAGVPLWVAYYRRALPRFLQVRDLLAASDPP